jgi:hypothetical protein
MSQYFSPAHHKHVRCSVELISFTIIYHSIMKTRNENERILKKILYFDIFSILLLFIKLLASKNFCFPDYCGLQGLIFCVMKCCSTVRPIAIIMYTDWSTQWSKSDTDHNKCNIFTITFLKILSIMCHLIFKSTGCWSENTSTSFLCILNSLRIGSCCSLSLYYKKILILNRLGQAVIILTCVWQVPGLNFGLHSACPDWGRWWLSSLLPGKLSVSACS